MSRFGHALVSLVLGVVIFEVALVATATANTKPVQQAQFINWTGRLQQSIVKDGSVLTQYQGMTEAQNRPGMVLSVSFSPRFSCTPVISLQVPDGGVELGSASSTISTAAEPLSDVAMDLAAFPEMRDDDVLDLRVDGSSVDFPLIVDANDSLNWYFNGNARARETLKLQLDIGDVATVAVADDRKIVFSLLGSRKSLDELQSMCREHEPIPFEP